MPNSANAHTTATVTAPNVAVEASRSLTRSVVAGEVKRTEIIEVYPEELILNDINYRYGTQAGESQESRQEQILAMVQWFLSEGRQLQTIEVSVMHDKRLKVVFGDTRHRAALHINANKMWPYSEDGRMKLKCTLINCNPEEAFVMSISENLYHNQLTVIDISNAVNTLSSKWLWDDKRIMERFGKTGDYGWMAKMRQYYRLPNAIKSKVHSGHIKAHLADFLATLPTDEIDNVLEDATVLVNNSGDDTDDAPWEDNVPDAVGEATGTTAPKLPNPRVANSTSKPAKLPTRRAAEKAARARGLVTGKKIALTIPSYREFWEPLAEDKDSLITRLAKINVEWLKDSDHDTYYKNITTFLASCGKR